MAEAPIPVNNHEDHNGKEIRNVSLEKLSADPTGPGLYEGRIWHNTTADRIKTYDGTTIRALAYEDELPAGGAITIKGNLDVEGLATIATPSAATNLPATLNNGDAFIISNANAGGTTLTAIGGDDVVSNDDVIVFLGANGTAKSSLTTDWSDFHSLEGNQESVFIRGDVQSGVTLTADTDVIVTFSNLSVVDGLPLVYNQAVGNQVLGPGQISIRRTSANGFTLNSGVTVTVDVRAPGAGN